MWISLEKKYTHTYQQGYEHSYSCYTDSISMVYYVAPRKDEKGKYKVAKWSAYNKSLRRRGMISVYFPEGDIRSLFINNEPYVKGDSGRLSTYLTPYV